MSAKTTTQAEKAYTVTEAAALKSVSRDFILAAIKRTDGKALLAKNISTSSKIPNYRINASDLESWWSGLADA